MGNTTTQSRKWLLTINNPLDHGLSHDRIKDILSTYKNLVYWCMSDEIGDNKTYHTHLFICRKTSPIPFKQVKKDFPSAHIDPCKGTAQENRDYIRKEGKYEDTLKAETNLKDTFEEFGDLPDERQGKRNDLIALYDMVKDGKSNYEILEENPNYMRHLDTIDRTREIIRSEHFKNTIRDLYVEYRFGSSGIGKSRSLVDRYGFENVYRVTDYSHPFDNYSGQDVIIFEEFYSSNIRINDMLNYLDIYPLLLPSRYRNKQACYTKVFINSNIPFDAQYSTVQKEYRETWKALCRRIHCITYFDKNGNLTHYYSMDEYNSRYNDKWVPIDEQIKLDFD